MNIYPPPLSVYKKNYIGLCQTIIVPSLWSTSHFSHQIPRNRATNVSKPKLWMILTNKPLFVENVSWWVSRQFVDGYPTIFNQFPVKRWLETASQAVKVNLSFHSQTPFCVQKNEGRAQKTLKHWNLFKMIRWWSLKYCQVLLVSFRPLWYPGIIY